MSQNLKKYAACIKTLHKATSKDRRKLLTNVLKKDSFVNCICECTSNLLGGAVPLTKVQKKRLEKQKKALRLLSSKKTSLKKKRKIIQKGGFLGAILEPIVSVLGSLFN